jgi:hypothetical protein
MDEKVESLNHSVKSTAAVNMSEIGVSMQWAVEYELPSGMHGLCIFQAENGEEAQVYIRAMQVMHGHSKLFNLKQLPEGATVEDLIRLFPRPLRSTC